MLPQFQDHLLFSSHNENEQHDAISSMSFLPSSHQNKLEYFLSTSSWNGTINIFKIACSSSSNNNFSGIQNSFLVETYSAHSNDSSRVASLCCHLKQNESINHENNSNFNLFFGGGFRNQHHRQENNNHSNDGSSSSTYSVNAVFNCLSSSNNNNNNQNHRTAVLGFHSHPISAISSFCSNSDYSHPENNNNCYNDIVVSASWDGTCKLFDPRLISSSTWENNNGNFNNSCQVSQLYSTTHVDNNGYSPPITALDIQGHLIALNTAKTILIFDVRRISSSCSSSGINNRSNNNNIFLYNFSHSSTTNNSNAVMTQNRRIALDSANLRFVVVGTVDGRILKRNFFDAGDDFEEIICTSSSSYSNFEKENYENSGNSFTEQVDEDAARNQNYYNRPSLCLPKDEIICYPINSMILRRNVLITATSKRFSDVGQNKNNNQIIEGNNNQIRFFDLDEQKQQHQHNHRNNTNNVREFFLPNHSPAFQNSNLPVSCMALSSDCKLLAYVVSEDFTLGCWNNSKNKNNFPSLANTKIFVRIIHHEEDNNNLFPKMQNNKPLNNPFSALFSKKSNDDDGDASLDLTPFGNNNNQLQREFIQYNQNNDDQCIAKKSSSNNHNNNNNCSTHFDELLSRRRESASSSSLPVLPQFSSIKKTLRSPASDDTATNKNLLLSFLPSQEVVRRKNNNNFNENDDALLHSSNSCELLRKTSSGVVYHDYHHNHHHQFREVVTEVDDDVDYLNNNNNSNHITRCNSFASTTPSIALFHLNNNYNCSNGKRSHDDDDCDSINVDDGDDCRDCLLHDQERKNEKPNVRLLLMAPRPQIPQTLNVNNNHSGGMMQPMKPLPSSSRTTPSFRNNFGNDSCFCRNEDGATSLSNMKMNNNINLGNIRMPPTPGCYTPIQFIHRQREEDDDVDDDGQQNNSWINNPAKDDDNDDDENSTPLPPNPLNTTATPRQIKNSCATTPTAMKVMRGVALIDRTNKNIPSSRSRTPNLLIPPFATSNSSSSRLKQLKVRKSYFDPLASANGILRNNSTNNNNYYRKNEKFDDDDDDFFRMPVEGKRDRLVSVCSKMTEQQESKNDNNNYFNQHHDQKHHDDGDDSFSVAVVRGGRIIEDFDQNVNNNDDVPLVRRFIKFADEIDLKSQQSKVNNNLNTEASRNSHEEGEEGTEVVVSPLTIRSSTSSNTNNNNNNNNHQKPATSSNPFSNYFQQRNNQTIDNNLFFGGSLR